MPTAVEYAVVNSWHVQNGGAAGPPLLTQNGVGTGPPAVVDQSAVIQADVAPAMVDGEWLVAGALALPLLTMALVVGIRRGLLRRRW